MLFSRQLTVSSICSRLSSCRRLFALGLVGAALVALLAAATPAQAAAPEEAVPSLALVPADAAFYTANLRIKEQIDAVLASRAWAGLQTIPLVQIGLTMGQMQLERPDSPAAQIKQFFAEEENQQLLALLKDVGSHEIFLYGDKDVEKLASLMLKMYSAMQSGQLDAQLAGDITAQKQTQQALLDALTESADQIVVPRIVLGFRVTEKEAAEAQIARLEGLLKALLAAQQPELVERLDRAKVGEAELLTFTVDGGMIPWDEVPDLDDPAQQQQLQTVIDRVKKLNVVVSLGVSGDYMLLSIGPSLDHLKRLGASPRLADRPEMKKLAAHAEQRITDVAYTSASLRKATVGMSKEDLARLADAGKMWLRVSGLDADLQKRLGEDVDSLVGEIQQAMSEPGASLAFSFISPRGIEHYSHDWTERPVSPPAKMTLLNHLGGTPLLAVVVRGQYDPQGYPKMAALVKKAHGYFEEIALPQMQESEQAQYRQVKELALPLVERFGEITEKMLLPSLADSQAAFVLDTSLASQEWTKFMPRTAQPLPLPAPALLLGVSDPTLLEKAMAEYRKLVNDAIKTAAQLSEGQLDEGIELPAPDVRELPEGKVFYYKVAGEVGVEKRLAPNAGLGKDVAVLSLVPLQTVRLLKETPFAGDSLLAEADPTVHAAFHIDFAGLIDAVTPWAELAVRLQASGGPGSLDEGDQGLGVGDPRNDTAEVKATLEQVHTAARVLKVLRGFSSLSYHDDDTHVVHSLLRIQDLEP